MPKFYNSHRHQHLESVDSVGKTEANYCVRDLYYFHHCKANLYCLIFKGEATKK